MNRTFEIQDTFNAWQGGEVLPQGFHPMTARYFKTKAGRLACKRALQRKLKEMGVKWDDVEAQAEQWFAVDSEAIIAAGINWGSDEP